MTIDPYDYADKLGIEIVYQELGDEIQGLYDGERIILSPGMSTAQERCTLAHELAHAKYDSPEIHKSFSARAEARADRQAAEWLIDHDYFADRAKYMTPGELALDLKVTGWLLKVFMDEHPELCHK